LGVSPHPRSGIAFQRSAAGQCRSTRTCAIRRLRRFGRGGANPQRGTFPSSLGARPDRRWRSCARALPLASRIRGTGPGALRNSRGWPRPADFLAIGSSGGSGVFVFVSQRTRSAVCGVNRCACSSTIASVTSRSGWIVVQDPETRARAWPPPVVAFDDQVADRSRRHVQRSGCQLSRRRN